jgi:predicted Zn-dependent protease with MMP-like domain
MSTYETGRAAPSLEEFHRLAEAAYNAMPESLRRRCGNVVIHVAEQAEPEILRSLGLHHPLELSGLFEGVDLVHQGVSNPHPFPNHVHLYRRAIQAEWRQRGDVSLSQLITHVLVHEIGHHFGLSDEDMRAIEAAAD